MKHIPLLALLLLAPAAGALAQGVTPSGVIFGDGRDFSQDLTRPADTAARPATPSATQRRRTNQQRRANQDFPGTGRPVTEIPAPTPQPGAVRSATTPPTRPAAPTRPQVAAPAEPRAVPAPPPAPLPVPATAPPSTRAAPITLLPGQSTGAARGTPASR